MSPKPPAAKYAHASFDIEQQPNRFDSLIDNKHVDQPEEQKAAEFRCVLIQVRHWWKLGDTREENRKYRVDGRPANPSLNTKPTASHNRPQ
jgi:hypothetical protein